MSPVAMRLTSTLLLALAIGCGGSSPEGKPAAAGPVAGGPGGGAPGASGGGARRPLEFPVEVQPVAGQAVEYTLTAVGSLEAFEVVEVTARVAGVVEAVRFREGDPVTPESVLVEIEPERYRLAVAQAEANLARAQAEAAEAESGLARRQSVNTQNPDLVREEDLESWRTRLAVARANAAQVQASLDLARLNLRDALVRAPASGIAQTRTVQTGQYVQPGAVLATLVRRDPLLLRFDVPERDATPLAVGMPVRFRLATGGSEYSAEVAHVAASAREGSRSVAVTANVDDPRRGELRPGAFAEVTIPIGGNRAAPVIPQTAVRPSERGFLAFVVEDGQARERILELGLRTPEGLVEVKSGLAIGEQLVIRGAEALRDGAAVKVAS